MVVRCVVAAGSAVVAAAAVLDAAVAADDDAEDDDAEDDAEEDGGDGVDSLRFLGGRPRLRLVVGCVVAAVAGASDIDAVLEPQPQR